MGIDRIGKGAPPVPPKPAAGPDPARGGEKTFEVWPANAAGAGAVAPVAPKGPGPLDRLRAGEIDLDRYLDLKVDEATAHLHGLRAQEMEGIRTILRDQLAADPALVDLVQQATGQILTPKD